MDKLFPDEKNKGKKLAEFFNKNGFFVVILLCIGIIGVTAVYVTTRNTTLNEIGYNDTGQIGSVEYPSDEYPSYEYPSDEDMGPGNSAIEQDEWVFNASEPLADEELASDASETLALEEEQGLEEESDQDLDSNQKNSVKGAATQASSITNIKTEATANTEATEVSGQAFNEEIIMPVFGELTLEFAMDKLVYSKTLEEWRAHQGMDIAAERGTPVKVVADGVVSDIKMDPRYGFMAVVDHQNGVKTVYANLASEDAVVVNQKVKQGEIIGSVGDTAAFETAEQSHLHFEVLKDGVHVNPMDYLPAFSQ